ncbi:MAG: cell wall biosis glycosyltransferase [Gemmatimonadetes bacterium]|nr:cell wall biosis glycosyltransferase [Gemmatimonadota bacterium]
MKSRFFFVLVSGIAVLLLVAITLSNLLARTPMETDSLALRIGISVTLTFLILLLIRYFVLLWLGYLQHIEAKITEDREDFVPPVTLLIPAYNEGVVIQSAIRSLLELDYPSYEILVIDDGSSDDTYARAAELEGRYGGAVVRVISKANGGKARALNTGISLARSSFIVCMDGDARLDRGSIRAAMRHFADARVGAVAGNVKVVNRVNLWTRLQALEYIEGLNMARRAQGFVRAVNIIPGPIGVFRREVLAEVGGYSTDTFAEDADLTLKVLTAGWQIVYEERAVARTEAPENLLDLIKQRYRWTRGILQALRKRAGWLVVPLGGVAVWISMLSMLFEAIIWPVMNVLGNLVFAMAAISSGAAQFVIYWWILLTLLDVAAALHTVAMEEEDLGLVPYAVVYRFFFVVLIDVAKLFATVEEAFNVKMTWGKLERAGRI